MPKKVPNPVPHAGKDILFKVLERSYANKSLDVYGLDIPRIKRMLPTSFPSVSATEIHADSPFLLEDGSLYLQEYESVVEPDDGLKYAKYVCAACDFLRREGTRISKVIIGVIYTGDVLSAPDVYDFGALRVKVEQVFLSRFDTDAMYADLKKGVELRGTLSDEEMLKLIVLPLTQPSKEKKQKLVEDAVGIAKKIGDEPRQLFGIAGITLAANKFIDKAYFNELKEWLRMTHLARLYEEEKIDAVNIAHRNGLEQGIQQGVQQGLQQGLQQGVQQTQEQFALNMLGAGMDTIQIMQITGLTRSELGRLRASVSEDA